MKTDLLDILHADCMDLMREYPDGHFDLAVVDPPYGIGYGVSEGFDKVKRKDGSTGHTARKKHQKKEWDNEPPSPDYFDELFRVSKSQIVWGGNYFNLPPTRGIVCWDKKQPFDNFSSWEMAWTSTDKPAAIFSYDNKGFMCKDGAKIHPTQKPVALYDWILRNYAKPGDTILDTHLGSMSIAIACHYAGLHLTGCELDADYYAAGIERVMRETQQTTLF